jgi:hypothetical protein
MKESTKSFLSLFFNEGETICVSPNKFGFHSIEQKDIIETVLKSPKEGKDLGIVESDINLMAINPVKGFRRDENVTAYRSFLVEVDFGLPAEQFSYIKSMNMPYSVCVFSGNKSLHFGIVLDTDLPSEEEWRRVAEWILAIMDKADQQTKNPTRSIRFPENIRKDGKMLIQKLVEMKKRIPLDELYGWLNKYPDKDPLKKEVLDRPTITATVGGVPTWVLTKLSKGIDYSRGRNNEWFSIAMGLALAGFEKNDIISVLDQYFVPERDFTRQEWLTTIKSAIKKASQKVRA